MLQVVLKTVLGKFTLDAVTRAAHAVSVGTSALNHESADYPVENLTVVKSLVNQADEVIHCVRCNLRV